MLEMKEQKESTSIKIFPSIWKKSKLEAICDDMDLGDYVAEALEFWNKNRSSHKGGLIKCRGNSK